MTSVLVTKMRTAHKDKFIGRITLDRQKALNALDAEMLGIIHQTLGQWRFDDSVHAIWIEGAGDRAFCAGGDVIALYEGMQQIQQHHDVSKPPSVKSVPSNILDFFVREYETDYQLYGYPKPIIAWGAGYVMGGGFGLYAGTKYRIATESTRYAMPENSIGLFPDVGASYFLNKLPSGVGMFLALTGAQVNATDAHHIGIATHVFSNQSKPNVLDALCDLSEFSQEDIDLAFEEVAKQATQINDVRREMPSDASFASLGNTNTYHDIDTCFDALVAEHPSNKWLIKAISTYSIASPLAQRLTFEQMTRGVMLDIEGCFRQELNVCFKALFQGEFCEGIRALLVDKDKKPQWQYASKSDVPDELVVKHFSFFEQGQHLLEGMAKRFDN